MTQFEFNYFNIYDKTNRLLQKLLMRRAFKLKKSKSEIFNDLKNSRKFNNWENYRENKIKMNVKNSDSIQNNINITDITTIHNSNESKEDVLNRNKM